MRKLDRDGIIWLIIIIAIMIGAFTFFPFLRGWVVVNVFKTITPEFVKPHYTFWDYWKIGCLF